MFSKAIFWFENMFYIPLMLIKELFYVPYIYIKIAFGIIMLGSILNILILLPLWLLFGFIFLMYGVVKDMYYFIKILGLDNKEDEQTKIEENEDLKQDKIIIIQEIIDVIKAV
jgi:hypothetical protein